jgi:hypothetical protein
MGHSELRAGFEAPMVGSTPGDAYLDKLSGRELISRQALHSLRHDATLAARGGCRILPELIVQRANAGIELTIATLRHEPKYLASGNVPAPGSSGSRLCILPRRSKIGEHFYVLNGVYIAPKS